MTRRPLSLALTAACLQDVRRALGTIKAAAHMPAPFKPDAVELARREYARGLRGAA